MSTYVLGVVAALAAPLVMTVGFYIWEGLWKGSSLYLNIFKNGLATLVFLIIIGCVNGISGQHYLQHNGTEEDISWILLSGLIGITVGDTCWLQAMGMIGARRVIVVDVTKPFLAAIIGFVGLNEPLTPLLFVGLFFTMGGVGLVSFEQTGPGGGDKHSEHEPIQVGNGVVSNDHTVLTFMGPGTVLETRPDNVHVVELNWKLANNQKVLVYTQQKLNVDGIDTLENQHSDTKQWTETLDTVAPPPPPPPPPTAATARCCGCCSRLVVGYIFASLNVLFDVFGSFLTRKFGAGMTTFDINAVRFGSSAATLIVFSSLVRAFSCVQRDSAVGRGLFGEMDWLQQMSRKNTWIMVSAGVLFVTVACPALSNWALFQLPLGICLCLTSVGPLFAIPMSYFVKKEKITTRTIVGSVLAIGGVVILQFTRE